MIYLICVEFFETKTFRIYEIFFRFFLELFVIYNSVWVLYLRETFNFWWWCSGLNCAHSLSWQHSRLCWDQHSRASHLLAFAVQSIIAELTQSNRKRFVGYRVLLSSDGQLWKCPELGDKRNQGATVRREKLYWVGRKRTNEWKWVKQFKSDSGEAGEHSALRFILTISFEIFFHIKNYPKVL